MPSLLIVFIDKPLFNMNMAFAFPNKSPVAISYDGSNIVHDHVFSYDGITLYMIYLQAFISCRGHTWHSKL